MKKLCSFLKLIRLYNLLIGASAVFLSAYLINIDDYYLIFLCALEVMSIMGLFYLMNDVLDINNDKINHLSRVLVMQSVTIREAKISQFFLIILIIILSVNFNFISMLLIYLIIIPLLYLYNSYFKKKLLIGNLLIAFLLGFVFPFSEIVLTNQMKFSIMPFILAFHLSFIRELIKDLHDYQGDLSLNMTTLPIIFGINKTCYFIAAYIIFSNILFIVPYYYGFYGNLYLISLIFCIEIPLIYSIFLLIKVQTNKTFKHLSLLHKILSILGLFVLLLTKK